MRNKMGYCFMCAMIVCGMTSAVRAELVTFAFEGEIDTGSIDDAFGILPANPTFSGTYTFESTTPDFLPADLIRGIYLGAMTGLTVDLGGGFSSVSDTLDVGDISVTNNNSGDLYQASTESTNNGGAFTTFSISLSDSTETMLNSIALPVTPPDVGNADIAEFFFDLDNNGRYVAVSGVLTSLTVVPEPASMVVLLCGGLMLARRRR